MPAGTLNRLLVLSGPSGAGKSTLLKRLFKEHGARFGFSVSHTTRAPRPGEVHGRDYHFVDRTVMDSLIAGGAFLESAEFSKNVYGTSFEAVRDVHASGRTCVLDIDLQGVQSVKRAVASNPGDFDVGYVFIAPPSIEVLKQRLEGRGTETPESIKLRLEAAQREMDFARANSSFHDRIIVNDDADAAYGELLDFITAAGVISA
jgi:guanylate kinase